MAWGGQKDFWAQDRIWMGNKEVWLLLSFKSDIYFWVLRCFCVNFSWISDLGFHSFRERTRGYLGQLFRPPWVQEYVGSSWLFLQYTFLLWWGTLEWGTQGNQPWALQGSESSRMSQPMSTTQYLIIFFQYIFPEDTGLWGKVAHWKEHSITRYFRHNSPCIIWSHLLQCLAHLCALVPASNHCASEGMWRSSVPLSTHRMLVCCKTRHFSRLDAYFELNWLERKGNFSNPNNGSSFSHGLHLLIFLNVYMDQILGASRFSCWVFLTQEFRYLVLFLFVSTSSFHARVSSLWRKIKSKENYK